MPLMLWHGKPLIISGKLAMHARCCCDTPPADPCDICGAEVEQSPVTVSIEGGDCGAPECQGGTYQFNSFWTYANTCNWSWSLCVNPGETCNEIQPACEYLYYVILTYHTDTATWTSTYYAEEGFHTDWLWLNCTDPEQPGYDPTNCNCDINTINDYFTIAVHDLTTLDVECMDGIITGTGFTVTPYGTRISVSFG